MSDTRPSVQVPQLPHFRTAEDIAGGEDGCGLFKFGDPFKVSDIGRVGRDTLQWILDHCYNDPASRPKYAEWMFFIDDLKKLPSHESEFVNTEIKRIVDTGEECDVDAFVFRDM